MMVITPHHPKLSLRTARVQLRQLHDSIHFFPVLCALLLILLTLLRISGTSVGLYNIAYYGPQQKDSNLIANHPRSIRSDELLLMSPLIAGQSASGLPYVNSLQGNGQNMSIIADTAYKDWSVIFKPQNLIFFVLPLEYAFAFKWWLLGFLLVVSCYYFCLAMLPKKRLWSALIAISLFFAPFTQWWYQISTTACVFYCFFIALLVIHLLKPGNSLRRQLALGGLLAYVIVCFGLILYPPFQIPCALATAAFLTGYFLETRKRLSKRQLKPAFVALGGSVAAAILILIIFVKTRASVVEAVTHTTYPGKRIVLSGSFSPSHFFSAYLAPFLQSDSRAAHYPLNQSEASNFVALGPFLLLPAGYTILQRLRRKQPLPWMLIALSVLLLLFLCRLFIPHLNFIFHILQLSSTPLVRMMLGIGLLGYLLLVTLLHTLGQSKNREQLPVWCGWASGGIAFVVSLVAGLRISHLFPGFIASPPAVIILSLAVGTIVWCLLQQGKLVTVGLGLLAVLAIISTANVNPLYRGLQPLTQSLLGQAIRQTGSAKDIWAVSGTRLIVSQPFAEGKRALTGVYLYPQPEIWKSLGATAAPEGTYNRFAHVIVNLDTESTSRTTNLELKAIDHFTINTSACSEFLRQSHVKYLITVTKISSEQCASLQQTINYPTMNFYIYQLRN